MYRVRNKENALDRGVTYSDPAKHDPNIKMMNSLCIRGTGIRRGNSNLLESSCTVVAAAATAADATRYGFCFFNKSPANGRAINITSFFYCRLLLAGFSIYQAFLLLLFIKQPVLCKHRSRPPKFGLFRVVGHNDL